MTRQSPTSPPAPKPKLATPSLLRAEARRDVAAALNALLADVLALYIKTKNFHWHVAGPHFKSYHELLDGQATELFAMTDVIAERVRKLGEPTLRSVGDIQRRQRVRDNDAAGVGAHAMLAELREDNLALAGWLRSTHAVCDESGDIASASLVETWLDEAERRVWFLYESAHADN